MSFSKRLSSIPKKLGFEKGDERNVLIGQYTTRIAWVYTTIVLLAWSIIGFAHTGRLGAEAAVFFTSQIVFWSSYLYYQRKLGG